MAREEVRDNEFVFLWLARARGVDQPSSGTHHGGCVGEHGGLRRGQRRQIVGGSSPANIRISSQRPKTRTRSIDKHGRELRPKGQRSSGVGLDETNIGRSGVCNRSLKKRDASVSQIARHEPGALMKGRRDCRRLAAGRCARIEDQWTRRGARQKRDDL